MQRCTGYIKTLEVDKNVQANQNNHIVDGDCDPGHRLYARRHRPTNKPACTYSSPCRNSPAGAKRDLRPADLSSRPGYGNYCSCDCDHSAYGYSRYADIQQLDPGRHWRIALALG